MSFPEPAMRQSGVPVILPPMGEQSPEVNARRSLTHWVWTPYMDINNLMPWGIDSQLGYREERWTVLKRCIPYPLGNLTHQEADREFAEGLHASGVMSGAVPSKEFVKYAQAQANELGERYSDRGLRVLLPLLGMDDSELVKRIVQVVQPFVYDIHEMREEFTAGASRRIEESNLSDEEKDKAYRVAEIMLSGAVDAEKTALREYNALITSMSDAQIGKPGIAEPNDFHRWICSQLNKPVPKRVDRSGGGGDGDSATVLKLLLDRDSRREQELAAQQRKIDELQQRVASQSIPESPKPEPRSDVRIATSKK